MDRQLEEAQESVIANFTNNNLRQPAVAGATIAVQPSTNVSVNPHPDGTQKAFHQALRDSNLGHMITESVRHQTLLAGVNEMEREDPPVPSPLDQHLSITHDYRVSVTGPRS